MALFGFRSRALISGLLTCIMLLGGLWLDLTRRGTVWDLLWNVTGETEPTAQLLGASQVVASWFRITPRTEAQAEIQNIPENPFGVNTFLQLEALPENRDRQLQLAAEAGFGWIRQEFVWEDIEIHGRGDFRDRRNVDTIGEISAWDKYDNIVDLAEKYDIQIIARLSNPPKWSQPETSTNDHGPPVDFQDYVNFATTVASRYQGRIHHYQIWNEPNIYPEWGDQMIDPAGYADMLCRTYTALKTVDPEIVVLTAAIAPNIDLSGHNAYDLLYLQRLYDFGVSACFDILSVQGYGLFSGPTDRRMRPFQVNFGRHLWLRDIMVANGDAHKPIWISEAGWNPVPSAAEVPDMVGRETYGTVTMQQAANYVPLAYERTLSEWPWIGMISYWYLKRHNDFEKNQSWYYFRLLEHDFSPTPVYENFKTMTQSGEWQNWRHEKSWSMRARERLPQILVSGWALIFAVFVLGQAVVQRLDGNP